MVVDIEIKYDKRHANKVELESDFKLQEEEKNSGQGFGWGRKWKTLTAEGKIGSGKNKIRIKTVNGSVYLKEK